MRAIILALLATPLAGASWIVGGESEPDSIYDTQGLMWTDPDISPTGAKLYLSGYFVASEPGGRGANPNVGPGGSRLLVPAHVSMSAVLGIWKDCNKDGAVGAASAALEFYSRALLPTTDVCPDGSAWNDGRAVRELLWVAPYLVPNVAVVADPEVRVWGDFGYPGQAAHVDCQHFPLPVGTTASTGGAFRVVDCQLNGQVSRSVNAAHPGLVPAGEDARCSTMLDVAIPLWGDGCGGGVGVLEPTTAERAAITVWDCDEETRVKDPTGDGGSGRLSQIDDPTPNRTLSTTAGVSPTIRLAQEDGTFAKIPAPKPELASHSGSYRLLVESSLAVATQDCGGRPMGAVGPSMYERDFLAVGAKRQSDHSLRFVAGASQSSGLVDRQMARLYGDVGVAIAGEASRGWRSDTAYSPPTFMGPTIRQDLQPAGPVHITTYARVGPEVLRLASAPGAGGVYGAEVCLGATEGIQRGWDCDPAAWAGSARVGTAYTLRDVDCYDGSPTRAPVTTTIVSSEGPCA